MGQSAGDDDALPEFDEAWVEAAKRTERDIRRYRTPPPGEAPAPWRAWTPPVQPERPGRPAIRYPEPRLGGRGVTGILLFVVLAAILVGALALGSTGDTSDRADPSAPPVEPVEPVEPTPSSAAPSAPDAPPATPATLPTTPRARALPWTAATAMPPPGPNAHEAGVFATIKVGTCLAETPNLVTITVVRCSGPHTDEVTLVRDITALFPTTPTPDQTWALYEQLCPAAATAWTGAADERYAPGYVWQFEAGVPGQVVRGFACSVMLSGHSPFNGTLRHAAA